MVGFWNLEIAAVFVLLYCVAVIIYRLFLSPLSKFPGPKLAAATLWYEFYYEVVKEGQFMFKIQELHKQYGPIVRINPFELHVDDPDGDFYHVVFSGTAVRNKNPYEIAQFGTNDTGFGTVDHYLHRKRRHALNPFFSTASIDRLEPIMQTMIEKLCTRIDEAQKSRTPLNMRLVYLCYTTDFITTYALNSSWNHLDSPDFSPLWCRTIKETGAMSKWTKQFPFLYGFLTSMPDWLVGRLNPGMVLVLDMQRKIKSMVQDINDAKVHGEDVSLNGGPRTIFQTYVLSSPLNTGNSLLCPHDYVETWRNKLC
ncbi:Cyrochrome P450 monooxygenase [Lachnellula arida]|uniref:Cyrochrome P450 monooxygenase n=1 Tax=Lachnellula arida TaxID=1316785 RepID=A0A8T9B7J4_9HELO|nr:Cyrochrome P450 monooxygenase [Lachnellula arida]